MPYPEMLIAPMRGEMTAMGATELKTAAAVDEAVKNTRGTLMIVVNSVCGCAAGKARPGLATALQHNPRPDVVTTVFAGADVDATERARSYFAGYAPSSPSIGILRDGQLVYMLERRDVETRSADMIAAELIRAFDAVCTPGIAQQ